MPTLYRALRLLTVITALVTTTSRAQSGASPPPPTAAETAAQQLFQAQDWAPAAAALERVVTGGTATPQASLNLAIALHQLGRYGDALEALEGAEAAGAPPVAVAVRRARSAARLGLLDQAAAALEKAAAAGFGQVKLLDTDPDFAALRADARFAAARRAVDRNAHPCLYDPEYRRFDFWLGEWEVVAAGAPAGSAAGPSHSSIQLILDGCVVLENWAGAGGYEGKSFNLWDAAKKRWQQTWVDNAGGIIELYGQVHDDGNLYYTG